jgi:hypothetical protein
MHYCKNDILGYFIASFVPSNSVEVTKEEYDEYMAQQEKENTDGTEMPN